ncbi:MAG: D-alanyl-D-alanine carboxypeptidase [Oscillospiraceae bacterium]|nr:D-alanyl-D-alanine carboxypeptidase [Oscillospiraceae bacterium]
MTKSAVCLLLALILLLGLGGYALASTQPEQNPEPGKGGVAQDTYLPLYDEHEYLPAALTVSATMGEELPVVSAILIDQQTGRVLFEQNPDEQVAPASITKVMTLLLVMEAVESGRILLQDMVTTSEEAASMGGSQIWLEPGEQMSVDELLRAVTIASANDASFALAEHIGGSETAFVAMMNNRAAELRMTGTNFMNVTGLDEDGHHTTARDVAIASRELIAFELIQQYSTVWMDDLRGGETQLVNTNRLVRFYDGATGLKTGTTSRAGSCLAATATRDGLSLVAVVMGSPTSDARFAAARGLLDFGFAHYISVTPPPIDSQLVPVRVLRGVQDSVMPVLEAPRSYVVEKGQADLIEQVVTLAEDVQAPVYEGQVLGTVEVMVDGSLVGSYPLKAMDSVERMTFTRAFGILVRSALTMA